MQAVNTQVDSGAFTRLYDFVLKLFLHFRNHFLYAGRMDSAVGYQLMQRKAANLTAYRVEG